MMKTLQTVITLILVLCVSGIGRSDQIEIVADSDFNACSDSTALRTNSAGQDWYESRQDVPGLLTLDTRNVAGNSTRKAKLTASASGNAYLTQELSPPQTGPFSVQWDIYVDSIENRPTSTYDRAAWMFIGDDTGTDPSRIGPNAEDSERFTYLAFYKAGGGIRGTMDLVARERTSGTSAFTTVATGLSLKRWYTIKVVVFASDGYEVYLDGQFQRTVKARTPKTRLTHISFAEWPVSEGAATFYVDNVIACPSSSEDDDEVLPPATVDLYDAGESDRSFSPQTLESGKAGQTITMHFSIGNKGTVASPSTTVTCYASENTTITSHDYQIGSSESLPTIAADSVATVDISRTFPTNIPPGMYYIGWIIDPGNAVAESDESNNTAYKQGDQLVVTEPVSSKPDLYDLDESYRSFSPLVAASGVPGQTITIRSTIKNGGATSSPQVAVGFYASADTNITTSDYKLDPSGNLPPSSRYALQASVVTVNPGGTGTPMRVISARLAPLPPSKPRTPSQLPACFSASSTSLKRYTHLCDIIRRSSLVFSCRRSRQL